MDRHIMMLSYNPERNTNILHLQKYLAKFPITT